MPHGLNDHLEEHLPYEVSMMQHTYLQMRKTTDNADWNAFMEAFCLHARNLKTFVTNDRGKGSNSVIASDFNVFSRKVPPQLTGAFQRLNEQIAHLAKKRVVDPARKFTFGDAKNILSWLEPAMRDFVASLGPEDRALWDRAARNKLTIKLPASPPSATNVIQQLTYTTSPLGGASFVIISRGS
jgi:hypothetical protein